MSVRARAHMRARACVCVCVCEAFVCVCSYECVKSCVKMSCVTNITGGRLTLVNSLLVMFRSKFVDSVILIRRFCAPCFICTSEITHPARATTHHIHATLFITCAA